MSVKTSPLYHTTHKTTRPELEERMRRVAARTVAVSCGWGELARWFLPRRMGTVVKGGEKLRIFENVANGGIFKKKLTKR